MDKSKEISVVERKDTFMSNLPVFVSKEVNKKNLSHLTDVFGFLFGACCYNHHKKSDSSGYVQIAAKSISSRLNMNYRKVKRHLADLLKHGFISLIEPPKRNRPSVYFVPLFIEYIKLPSNRNAQSISSSNAICSSIGVTGDPNTATKLSVTGETKTLMEVTSDPHARTYCSIGVTGDPIYIYNNNYLRISFSDEKILIEKIRMSFKKMLVKKTESEILMVIDFIAFQKKLEPVNSQVLRMANSEKSFKAFEAQMTEYEKSIRRQTNDHARAQSHLGELKKTEAMISEEGFKKALEMYNLRRPSDIFLKERKGFNQ